MSHAFLSDDWFDAAEAARNKYQADLPAVVTAVRINQVITGTPFDSGDIMLWMDSSSGQMHMGKGALETPDATVTTDYATARAIFVDQDQQVAMQAFMGGKIKVQGDMMKLMAMQNQPVNDAARAVAQEIKDLTE